MIKVESVNVEPIVLQREKVFHVGDPLVPGHTVQSEQNSISDEHWDQGRGKVVSLIPRPLWGRNNRPEGDALVMRLGVALDPVEVEFGIVDEAFSLDEGDVLAMECLLPRPLKGDAGSTESA